MFYESVSLECSLCQGDIFSSLPKAILTLSEIPYFDGENFSQENWTNLASEPGIKSLLHVKPVPAIVLTPDCDALRAEVITLAEIRQFESVEGRAKGVTSPKTLMKIITQQSRINQKWFYLPPDEQTGFKERMAVDFRSVFSIPREELEKYRSLRVARLETPAIEHFRERLSGFYRRYPYNEWYPLNHIEFEKYLKDKNYSEDIEPYSWQKVKEASEE